MCSSRQQTCCFQRSCNVSSRCAEGSYYKDRYNVTKYAELLRISSLTGNLEATNNAWVYLTSHDHGERYFPKTSYNKNETALLNMHFSLLASPAVLAAVFEIRRGDGWTCAAVRAEDRSRHQI